MSSNYILNNNGLSTNIMIHTQYLYESCDSHLSTKQTKGVAYRTRALNSRVSVKKI